MFLTSGWVIIVCVLVKSRFSILSGCFFFSKKLDVLLSSGWHVLRDFWPPYCYYYLRTLYFANFCYSEKTAKLSTVIAEIFDAI